VFEGSRSSTYRHKALTHDPLKEIWRKTLSNLRNQLKNENTKEAQKDPWKPQCRSFYTNHERFIQVYLASSTSIPLSRSHHEALELVIWKT
jgi:hypothetical protein